MDKATIPASSRTYRSSRLMHALICGFSLAFMASSNGQELIESSKQGAITAWKLQDFYAGYRDDNQHSYLKVKIKNQTVLWDANRMVFTPWLDSFYKRLSKSDTFLNNTNPLVLDSHTTIQIGGDVTRYALSFSQFIKVTNNDVSEAEFYIINRAGDDYVEQRFCCDSLEPVQTLRQELSSPQFVNVEKLENGDQIFLVVSAKLVYAVRVSLAPKNGVSIDKSVFFLPSEPFASALLHAGVDLKSRYEIVQHAIKSTQALPISRLGNLVSPEILFSR